MRAKPTTETSSEFKTRLQSSGWRLLGRGHFCSVLSKPRSNTVLRVNDGPEYDSGWEEFYSRLNASPLKDNPHFAKYGRVGKFACGSGKERDVYVVAEVERLYHLNSVCYESAANIIERIIDSVKENRGGLKSVKRIPMIPSSMYDAVAFLIEVKNMSKGKLAFDIHDFNVMSRKTGELVITDPFSFTEYYTW